MCISGALTVVRDAAGSVVDAANGVVDSAQNKWGAMSDSDKKYIGIALMVSAFAVAMVVVGNASCMTKITASCDYDFLSVISLTSINFNKWLLAASAALFVPGWELYDSNKVDLAKEITARPIYVQAQVAN